MVGRQRERWKTRGGYGKCKVGEATRIGRADGGHPGEERVVKWYAIADVLVSVLEEADGDGALSPSVVIVLKRALMVEAEVGNIAPKNRPKPTSGERVTADDKDISNASVEEAFGVDPVLAKEREAVAAATVDKLDDGGVSKPDPEVGVKTREEGGNLTDVEHVRVIGGGRVVGGRSGGDANLKQLNGAMKRKVAFEVEGDDARIARLTQDASEKGKGGKGDLLQGVVGGSDKEGVEALKSRKIAVLVGGRGDGGDERDGPRSKDLGELLSCTAGAREGTQGLGKEGGVVVM